MRSSRGLF